MRLLFVVLMCMVWVYAIYRIDEDLRQDGDSIIHNPVYAVCIGIVSAALLCLLGVFWDVAGRHAFFQYNDSASWFFVLMLSAVITIYSVSKIGGIPKEEIERSGMPVSYVMGTVIGCFVTLLSLVMSVTSK